jgi:hypothetical protein
MGCPLFEDYTRNCVEEYPDFVTYSNFDICQSDTYKKCPMYILIRNKFKCKYLQFCSKSYNNVTPKFIEKIFIDEKFKGDVIVCMMKKYCMSADNHMNCMRYKLFNQGKKPSLRLLPDGSKFHFIDMLLKRKLLTGIKEK